MDRYDDFLPEKFEGNSRKYSSQYFPFEMVQGNALNNFAMFEMIIAVTELLDRYKIIAVNAEIDIKPLIKLKPKKAILKFEKRTE